MDGGDARNADTGLAETHEVWVTAQRLKATPCGAVSAGADRRKRLTQVDKRGDPRGTALSSAYSVGPEARARAKERTRTQSHTARSKHGVEKERCCYEPSPSPLARLRRRRRRRRRGCSNALFPDFLSFSIREIRGFIYFATPQIRDSQSFSFPPSPSSLPPISKPSRLASHLLPPWGLSDWGLSDLGKPSPPTHFAVPTSWV